MIRTLAGGFGVAGVAALVLFASPASFGQAADKGEWGPLQTWPNVPIHVHVLPTGKVLFWGRREWANGNPTETLDPRDCTPRLWDPATGQFSATPKPGFNLFCAGHTFLGDGRLLVAGGHITDARGEKHATVYDSAASTWTRIGDMNDGRWYPTVVALPGGAALVSSGLAQPNQPPNPVQQLLDRGSTAWRNIVTFHNLPLYPRLHVVGDGRVFLSGPLRTSQLLDPTGAGSWTVVGDSAGRQREDGCAVLYDADKVLIVGGGLPPQATAEVIDLSRPATAWRGTGAMAHARRHHNATLLPDGTVLVTGGTAGGGGPHPFNDLSRPVRTPELWNPATGAWLPMADEAVPRLYHSVAALLPDGRVLSGGGGEYRLPNGADNANADSRRDVQLFSPPYLARGPRPTVTAAPDTVAYGQDFAVATPDAAQIGRVTWVRLSSVTHSVNMGQRMNVLAFAAAPAGLTVTAPADDKVCPPGHYMLFVLNRAGVPSVARIVRIG